MPPKVEKKAQKKSIKKPLKQPSAQLYLLESMMEREDQGFAMKPMFGGTAVYYAGLLVMFLCDEPQLPPAKRVWHGLLFPTEREHHPSLQEQWPALKNHSVLPKWMYLSLDEAGYEEAAPEIIAAIERGDRRFGIVPGVRKRKGNKPNKNK